MFRRLCAINTLLVWFPNATSSQANRREYFSNIIDFVKMGPAEFPDPANRKKRVLPELSVAPPPPPKAPSKLELKAIEKKDRQLLNVLKVQLQPIMDQINRKYKKFRQPAIPFSQLTHLYAEADPHYVRPDVAEGESRPFEIVKDKHGNDVLRETATGKCFYNLETTTIEERLSNGFYTRPKDFLFDIKTLAKDSRKIGDKERTLKANELVSNVEVDVANVENATSTIDWEALFHRQLQRAQAVAEKERKRKAVQSIVDIVQSDLANNDSDSLGQGPVMLGEKVPGTRNTTARFQVMSPPRANGPERAPAGDSLPNGTLVQNRGVDVAMSGTDETGLSFTDVRQMQPPERKSGAESGSGILGTVTTQVSQLSAITSVPAGVSPSAVVNDASTTKTSDPSSKSSNWNTQATNGFHGSSMVGEADNSQMPDTLPLSQHQSSGEPWMHSQAHAMAGGHMRTGSDSSPSYMDGTQHGFTSGLSSGHNANPSGDSSHLAGTQDETSHSVRNSGGSSQQQTLATDERAVRNLLDDVTERTSGCSIEQLEQINRELMEEIWRTRGEANRMVVLTNVRQVFNDTILDIENTQGLLQSSQDDV
jgi:hypothetical protein